MEALSQLGRQTSSSATTASDDLTEPTNNDYSTSAEQQTKAEVCADEVTLKEQKFVDIKHNSAIVNGDSDTDLGAPAVTDMQNIGGTKPQPHQASIGARCSSSDDGALMSASTQHMCRTAIPTTARMLKSLSKRIQYMPDMSKRELLTTMQSIGEMIFTTMDNLDCVLRHREKA